MNCKECDQLVDLRAGDEIGPGIGRLADDYGDVELCRACFSIGWGPITPSDIANDPELSRLIGIVSPIQPKL